MLPTYDFEANDSYNFIKKSKKVKIFDRYSYLITRELMNAGSKLKGRTLIMIDDAALSAKGIFEPNFYSMLSIARHLGISLIISYHSLTSGRTLSPFVRSNCEYRGVRQDSTFPTSFQRFDQGRAGKQRFHKYRFTKPWIMAF